MVFQETYNPIAFTANAAIPACYMAGFLCSTSGNIQIRSGSDGTGTVVVATMPVVAGAWHPIPFAYPKGAYVELTNGATGTFGVF